MRPRVIYEWLIEEMDSHGDIHDVNHYDFAGQAVEFMQRFPAEPGMSYSWGLVRNEVDRQTESLLDRSWCYVDSDGMLPKSFCDSNGNAVATVPKQLRREFNLATQE